MDRPALARLVRLFTPLDEYYPRREDYRTTAHHHAAIDVWETYGDPTALLKGMTPKAKRRFPEGRPRPVAPNPQGEPMKKEANPFDGFDLYGGAVCALLAILICAPAIAQDNSAMSDEALHAERDALMQRTFSNSIHRGYRGRVTSPNYHVEWQMRQLDKQQAADDAAQADRNLQELIRRGHARAKAEREAEVQAYRDSSRRQHEQAMGLIEQFRQSNSTTRAAPPRGEDLTPLIEMVRKREQAESQVYDFWQRERQETEAWAQQSNEPWEADPLPPDLYSPQPRLMYPRPETAPTVPGAYFPDPADVIYPQ